MRLCPSRSIHTYAELFLPSLPAQERKLDGECDDDSEEGKTEEKGDGGHDLVYLLFNKINVFQPFFGFLCLLFILCSSRICKVPWGFGSPPSSLFQPPSTGTVHDASSAPGNTQES